MAFEREKKVVVMRSISQFICTYAGGGWYDIWERERKGSSGVIIHGMALEKET
jgi:hypothetical protein